MSNRVVSTCQDGDGLRLWNPHVDRARLRRRSRHGHREPFPGEALAGCAAVTVVGLLLAPGFFLLCLALGLLAHVIVWWASNRPTSSELLIEIDHGNCQEQDIGELWYCTCSLTTLPPSIAALTKGIITAVGQLHRNAPTEVLDADQRRRVHTLAWDTVRCLYQSRNVRKVLQAASREPERDEHLRAVRQAVATIDRRADRVLDELRHTVNLATRWRETRHRIDTLAHDHAVIAGSHLPSMTATTAEATEMRESVEAYVSAARDLLHADPLTHLLTTCPRATGHR
ncbi:hypothetical protein M8C13_08945 [Crossiella sp. SN42]|uniref:hypothetical protein n=1 Tax=Crossiella sp. SN42 TaxID=2944808 RepID=UPI00207CCD7D|nr:hypothetical protein [Crossiella sp. SN42]MCO1575883.1 hypothetical protein [Crossiella sp. SN42]